MGNRVKTYDYIVIGGGTAGCIVAARLAEDPDVRILLLEARKQAGYLLTEDPNGYQQEGFGP